MRFLKDLLGIFYPNLCLNCENLLFSNEIILCSNCKNELPIVNEKDTFIPESFLNFDLENFEAFLYYRKDNITQKLIHQLKYKEREDIGVFLGEWFNHEIKKRNLFSEIDYIIPVPLHKKKLKIRGYNQVDTFARCISKGLKTNFSDKNLIRISNTKTQTKKSRFERYNESSSKFSLVDTSFYEYKHVLLVDDVITTGATIESCVKALLKTKNIKISVLTMAYTLKV